VTTAEIQKLFAQSAIVHHVVDPTEDAPVEVAWVDMRDFGAIAVSLCRVIGTSAVTTFRIIASETPDGAAPIVLKTHALAAQPDAPGDQLFLEALAIEMAHLGDRQGKRLRYLSAEVEFDTSEVSQGDEVAVVSYIRHQPRQARAMLTQDIIA
jgi:hypothetical protein